tara:strand:+ start:223 stop:627 length:405 start_codon:yes stop_codon:yes gene_type:complete
LHLKQNGTGKSRGARVDKRSAAGNETLPEKSVVQPRTAVVVDDSEEDTSAESSPSLSSQDNGCSASLADENVIQVDLSPPHYEGMSMKDLKLLCSTLEIVPTPRSKQACLTAITQRVNERKLSSLPSSEHGVSI